jgi:hypothetical protein
MSSGTVTNQNYANKMLLDFSIDILQGKLCHRTDLGVGKIDEHVKDVAKNKR